MARILYFDCFSGASGDMLLGSLLDAGLPLDALRDALGSLAVEHLAISASRVVKHGIAATGFTVQEVAAAGGPESRSHEHRHVPQILKHIEASRLSVTAKARAAQMIRRLAEVEAAIHQMPVERVHLHEVGALDSIADIVGAAFAFDWFGADEVVVSPVNVGSGTVTCAHGTLPVPAPATAALLSGVPVYSDGPPVEMTTPTGALVLTAYATRFGPMPPMTIERIGYGAGQRDLPGRANVLRVLVGESVPTGAGAVPTGHRDQAQHERVLVLQAEIDDMPAQFFGALMDRLLEAGALDVFFTPAQMKKNRPGTLATVIAAPERREALTSLIFRETTTLGVRYHEMFRACLPREVRTVATPLGPARVKVGLAGGEVVNAMPEYDDVVRLAAAHALPVKQVHALILRALNDETAR